MPDSPQLTAGEAYRFRHILIRDAAYAMLPKAERASLHEGFAEWLEKVAGGRIGEYIEVVAYHLEQAASYQHKLGLEDALTRALELRAATQLRAAGRAARNRDDLAAAASLLDRSARLADRLDPERAWDVYFLAGLHFELGHPETEQRLLGEVSELVELSDDEKLKRRWGQYGSAVRSCGVNRVQENDSRRWRRRSCTKLKETTTN